MNLRCVVQRFLRLRKSHSQISGVAHALAWQWEKMASNVVAQNIYPFAAMYIPVRFVADLPLTNVPSHCLYWFFVTIYSNFLRKSLSDLSTAMQVNARIEINSILAEGCIPLRNGLAVIRSSVHNVTQPHEATGSNSRTGFSLHSRRKTSATASLY